MRYYLKIRLVFIIILCILVLSCNDHLDNGIVAIDANKEYPEIDLKLSDITEISYIHLKQGDNKILITKPRPRSVFITEDRIFVADGNMNDPKIVVYNRNGDPLYIIGRKGRGPGELIGTTCFAVDTIREEVFIWCQMGDHLYVYGMDGKFKRSKSGYDRNLFFNNIDNININTLVGFLPHAKIFNSESREKKTIFSRTSLSFLDKNSLTLYDLPEINFERIHLYATGTNRSSLLTTKHGTYFYTLSSDTTFFINDSLKITPRFVDATKYPNPGERCIFPSLETDRYIFLNTFVAGQLTKVNIDISNKKFLVYDKSTKKIFSLNSSINKNNPEEHLFLGSVNWSNLIYGKSLNQNYVADFVYYHRLIENYDKLSDTLKRITDKMTEDDNPVLMLIKFK